MLLIAAADKPPETTPPLRYFEQLTDMTEQTPARTRRLVQLLLHHWGFEQIVDDAMVVVSELLTNAFVHAGGRCQLALFASGRGVHIRVRDYTRCGAGRIQAAASALDSDLAEGGRGVRVVCACSASFGVEALEDGKVAMAFLPADGVW